MGQITKKLENGWYYWKKAGYERNSRIGLSKEDKRIKHSKHLIELVEVGDMVNGERVLDVIFNYSERDEIVGGKIITEVSCFLGGHRHYIYFDNIKSILTHEQYEQNCFKVEEK